MKKYILEVQPSPEDSRDFLVGSIYSSPVVLPSTLDLRDELPTIRDQGAQGSCSAQVASCMKEWQEYKDIIFKGHMSPQFIYNLRENSESYGMYPRDTMKILQREGIVPEHDYPYGSMYEIPEALIQKAHKYQIAGYAKIFTVNELKKALVGNGPCYIAFPVYNWDEYFWRLPEGGDESGGYGGHAVSLCGYTEDSFIIRNSWGSEWGFEGYTYYPFDEWGAHWEVWTSMDADSNPIPEPDVDPADPAKKDDLEDDLKKKSNDRLKWWQKIFFCFNKVTL